MTCQSIYIVLGRTIHYSQRICSIMLICAICLCPLQCGNLLILLLSCFFLSNIFSIIILFISQFCPLSTSHVIDWRFHIVLSSLAPVRISCSPQRTSLEAALELSLQGRLDSVSLGWTRHGRLEQVRLHKECRDPEITTGLHSN